MTDSSWNVLIVTLDSLRWDVFSAASLQRLKGIVQFRQACSHGTYTLPSHISLFQGILPHCYEPFEFYNRFVAQLFRIETSRPTANALFSFPRGSRSILTGFRGLGFKTFGVGAVGWFRSELLTDDFDEFVFTGIDVKEQAKALLNWNSKWPLSSKLFFWNIGETHDPYDYGGFIREQNHMREKLRQGHRFCPELFNRLFSKQKAAVEYAESWIMDVYDKLCADPERSCCVICADHGDCFGEDNLYGHGFFHEKVIQVPLGIHIPQRP